VFKTRTMDENTSEALNNLISSIKDKMNER
jgi:hypothetical protein